MVNNIFVLVLSSQNHIYQPISVRHITILVCFCDENKIWYQTYLITFLKTKNYYFDFDFADCQEKTKYSPVSCPNLESVEFEMFNETHLSVTFLPNNLTNTQVTIRRSGFNKNLKPLLPGFSEANSITFQFKTDESYEVELDFFTEDNGDGNSNCQWNFIPQNKAVSYKGENIVFTMIIQA